MKLDDLKNIKPQKISVQNADPLYADYLCSLPNDKPKKRILAAVGTVAAAVAIVAIVALWALIGRGLRGTDADTPIVPADETVELTDEIKRQFEEMAYEIQLFALPEFARGEIPAQSEVIDYVYYLNIPAKDDLVITASELNDFAYDTFGVKTNYTTGVNYDSHYVVNATWGVQPLLSFTRSSLPDGTPIITLTYGEKDVSVTTLSYVPISDFEPDYFIEHTTDRTVYVHKVASKYKEYIYKITGDDAKEFIQLINSYNKKVESSECICFPTHRITFSGISCDIVMGDAFCSHLIYTASNTKYTFTQSEHQRLTQLFEKCLVEENKDRIEHLTPAEPSVTELTVTVNDTLMPQKNGSYTISGDDAKTLIKALETKPYAYDTAKFLPSITLTVGERTYYLHTGNDPFLRTGCGQYPLDSEDTIIQIVQKYTDFGWNSNGNGWYETDDGYYVTNNYGKTFEKYITRTKAVRIANAEAINPKYNYQPWASDFNLDENSKDAVLLSDYTGGTWVDEWKTEHYSEGAVCWAVRLFDRNDALTSLILYIDAKTANVVGGATLSD